LLVRCVGFISKSGIYFRIVFKASGSIFSRKARDIRIGGNRTEKSVRVRYAIFEAGDVTLLSFWRYVRVVHRAARTKGIDTVGNLEKK